MTDFITFTLVSMTIGHFILRFGMISRGTYRGRRVIQFLGGIILSISFLLILFIWNLEYFFVSILISFIPCSMLAEFLTKITYSKLYSKEDKWLADKYNTTPEKVRKDIEEYMDKGHKKFTKDLIEKTLSK